MSQQTRLTALAQAIGAKIKSLMPRLLPSGGAVGQALVKISAADYAASWAAHSSTIAGLSDVSLTNLTDTQRLSYSLALGKWLNVSYTAPAIGNLTDVLLTAPAAGHLLTYDAANSRWKNSAAPASGATALSGLSDVAIASPTNAQVLTYNTSTGKWANATPAASGGVSTPATTTARGVPVYGNTTGSALATSMLTITTTGALQTSGVGSGTNVGDPRGVSAIDLQVERSNTFYVASGASSVVSGGGNNWATSSYSTVGGGFGNIAAANYATVAGGRSNQANGVNSAVAGGLSNNAAAAGSAVSGGELNVAGDTYSAIGGGRSNSAGASYSTVAGGYQARAGRYGESAQASGQFASAGDAQTSVMVLRRQSADAVAAALSPSGAGLGAANTTDAVALVNGDVIAFSGTVVAATTSAADTAAWTITGLLRRGASGTSVLVSSSVTSIGATAGAAAWVVALVADAVSNGLAINTTGAAATNIRWVCRLQIAEVKF